MRYLVLSMIAFCAFGAENTEPAQTLPPSVQRVSDQLDRDIAAANEVYRQAVERAKTNALRSLDREERAIVRSGDLDAALAIRSERERIQLIGATDILGNPIVAPATNTGAADTVTVVGSWNGINRSWRAVVVFTDDGRFTNGRNSGSWTFANNILTLNWDNYAPETLELNGNRFVGPTCTLDKIN